MRIGFEIRQAQQCFIIFELKFEPIVKSSFRVRIPFPSLRKALRRAAAAAAGRDKCSKAPRSRQGTTADSPSGPEQYLSQNDNNSNNNNIASAQKLGQTSGTNSITGSRTTKCTNSNVFALPNNQSNNNNKEQQQPSHKESKKKLSPNVRTANDSNLTALSSPERKLEKHTVSTGQRWSNWLFVLRSEVHICKFMRLCIEITIQPA